MFFGHNLRELSLEQTLAAFFLQSLSSRGSIFRRHHQGLSGRKGPRDPNCVSPAWRDF